MLTLNNKKVKTEGSVGIKVIFVQKIHITPVCEHQKPTDECAQMLEFESIFLDLLSFHLTEQFFVSLLPQKSILVSFITIKQHNNTTQNN